MASQEKRMGGGGATRGPTNGGKLEVGEFTFPKVNVAREDWWLEDDPGSFWGKFGLFSEGELACAVSCREYTFPKS